MKNNIEKRKVLSRGNSVLLLMLIIFILIPTMAGCGKEKGKQISCTVEITCHNLSKDKSALNENLRALVPESGVILKKIKVKTTDKIFVLQVTERVCKDRNIVIVYQGNSGGSTGYIEGINNIFEKDAGKTSGWMYKVNGKLPNESAGERLCRQGDKIEWGYVKSYKDKF